MIEQGLAMLVGPGQTMAMMMAATIIEDGDVASKILRPRSTSRRRGRVFGVLKSMPSDSAMKHWHKYRELRKASLQQYGTIDLALQYYQANTDDMNDGALASWEDRIDPGLPDALCTAMDCWARAESVFWSEWMNQPQKTKITTRLEPDARVIMRRSSPVPRGVIPDWATRLTAAIDVQERVCGGW